MSQPLVTYLEDHLAGARYAVELLEALRDQHKDEPLGYFAEGLLEEVEADKETLEQLASRVGTVGTLKQASAWLVEKVSHLKLKRDLAGDLGTFESLEFITLGILGKRALWRALASVQPGDERLAGFDFEALIARAEAQHGRSEKERLDFARRALRP